MSKYCLKAIIKDPKEIKKDNKIVYSFKVSYFELYKDNQLVKKTKKLETKRIMNNLKSQNIKLRKEDDYMILNQKFINDYVTKPISKKGLAGLGILSTVGIITLAGIYNSISADATEEVEQNILPLEQTTDDNEIKAVVNEIPNQEIIETEYEDADELYEVEVEDNEIVENNEITFNDLNESSIVSFNFEDRSDDFKGTIKEEYGDIINKYSAIYGVDPQLVEAIISQEKPDENSTYNGGNGIMQVEYIWDDKELTCYNFEEGCYETIIVDTDKANKDPDYCCKAGCMIIGSYAEIINKKGLTNAQTLEATLLAYNKGITAVNKALNNTDSFEEAKDLLTSTSSGDNSYLNNVLSYLKDGTVIHMQCVGKDYYVGIDNQTVKEYTI